MRSVLRRLLPAGIRKKMYSYGTRIQDYVGGVDFASLDRGKDSFFPILVHEQAVTPSKSYLQKVHNFNLAIAQIHKIVLKPKQVFSFHNVVGEACSERGYKKSRSLHNGVLTQTHGGGLCQLAGLIYQVSLQLGLDIVERHNHSVDIYTDETRYTPLGTDATIVYPFKDVRIRNNCPFSLRFRFHIVETKISLVVESTGLVPIQNLTHQIIQEEPKKIVHTKNDRNELVAISVYGRLS